MDQIPIQYLIPALLIVLMGWRFVSTLLVRRRLPALLAAGAQLVDVRSAAEFASGHHEGSRNIPLETLSGAIESLDQGRPVVVCCASGTRSAIALRILRKKGFRRVVNAGSWRSLG
jgi:rhodanese-related sulfurtransferase